MPFSRAKGFAIFSAPISSGFSVRGKTTGDGRFSTDIRPMQLNPLSPVTDYQSMLNRIFWFTTASALVAIWMLRPYVPGLNTQLRSIDFAVELSGDKVLPIPGGYLLPALAIGILTRVYRLHARISDWLGIRECFDIEIIIGELAEQLSIDLIRISDEELRERRAEHHAEGLLSVRGRYATAHRRATGAPGARRLVVVLDRH